MVVSLSGGGQRATASSCRGVGEAKLGRQETHGLLENVRGPRRRQPHDGRDFGGRFTTKAKLDDLGAHRVLREEESVLYLHVVPERRDFGRVFVVNDNFIEDFAVTVPDDRLGAGLDQGLELFVPDHRHLTDPLGHVSPDVGVGELLEGNGPADVVPLGRDCEAEIAVPFEVVKLELALEPAVGLAGDLADKRQVVFDGLADVE